MVKESKEASKPRDTPLPGVSSAVDTSDNSEAGTEQCFTQAGVGGETKVTGDGDGDARSLTIRGCQHDRRGYCATHGTVAVKKWREIPCLKAGPGGSKVRTVRKKHFYECEVGPRGRSVLRQTLLTFCSKTPSVATLTGGGHEGVGGDLTCNFSSTTEGQTRGAARPVGLEKQKDEKSLD